MDLIDRPSPNFDDRALTVTMIVLHYTGMPDCQGALDRMTSPGAKVSAHYCIDEDGTTYRLVDEAKRAWHAGKSYWRGGDGDRPDHALRRRSRNPRSVPAGRGRQCRPARGALRLNNTLLKSLDAAPHAVCQ